MNLTAQLRQTVEAIARPEGRLVGTTGHERARYYLAARMRALGLRPFAGGSFELPYTRERTAFCNIVGVAPGTNQGRRPILIGAHYDSVLPAPCADDNAAAVAIALAVAERLLAEPAPHHVAIALFDAEEPPHYLSPAMGSVHFYEHQREGAKFDAAFIMDLVGHDVPLPVRMLGLLKPSLAGLLFISGVESDPALAALVRDSLGAVRGLPVIATLNRYIGDVSDHHVFRAHGAPYLFLSCGRWDHYHSETDTPEKLNYRKMARIVEYLLLLVRSLGEGGRNADADAAAVKTADIDTTELEIRSVTQALGRFGLPLVLRMAGLEQLSTRDDLDKLAEALVSRYGL